MKNKKGLLVSFIMIFVLMINLRVYAAEIPSSKRIAGGNRYNTAVEISKEGWQTSNTVIIATGEDFPDALCAAPLAKQLNAPILLTGKNILNVKTGLELTRLTAKKVYIIGGPGVVSDIVKQQIETKGIVCERIFGNNRYATSIEVAKHLNLFDKIVVATGDDFPDALSIAPIAAKIGIPIILTNKTNIPNDVRTYINSKNITKSFIIGGTGVITDNVKAQLPLPERIYGSNRYETNIAILNRFNSELNFAKSYLATGSDFPDALAGSALAPKSMSPIILTDKTPGTVTKDYVLNKFKLITSLNTLGGTGVIPESAISILLHGSDKAIAATSLVLKSSPGIPYKTLGTIKAGTAVEVYGGVPIGMDQGDWYGYQQYGWSKIKYKNNYAWVKTHELRFSNPYNWAPGIKEKFENDIVEQGYANTKASIQYKIYEKLPAGAIGAGFYQVYTDVSGKQSIVNVNVKTGWYHG